MKLSGLYSKFSCIHFHAGLTNILFRFKVNSSSWSYFIINPSSNLTSSIAAKRPPIFLSLLSLFSQKVTSIHNFMTFLSLTRKSLSLFFLKQNISPQNLLKCRKTLFSNILPGLEEKDKECADDKPLSIEQIFLGLTFCFLKEKANPGTVKMR